MRWTSLLLALALAAASALAQASEAQPTDRDSIAATRAVKLSEKLRCLVCQNQSIDESEADLARDLRLIVRERIAAGEDDAQVKAFLVERYGDFVLLDPPVKPKTWLLWFGPAAVLAMAMAGAALYLRRGPRRADARLMRSGKVVRPAW